jgi:hypothetical protein
VTGVVSLQGRNAKGMEAKIPSLVKIIETEQEELKQFDTELEKKSLI